MLPGHHHTTSIPDRPGLRSSSGSGSGSGSGLGPVAGGQHPFRHNNGSNASLPSDHPSARPQRPSRRAIPSPASSFSQMTLHDNASNPNISIESMESQRPVNRRSNRDFRIIPSTEAEGVDQFNLKDSIRHSQTLHKNSPGPEVRQRNSSRTSLNTSNNGNASQSHLKLPALLPEPQEDEEDYFGDILDKYCNSDEDPISPMTASPTSPFSSAPTWKALGTAQPPTPPISRAYKTNQNENEATPPRRSAVTNNGTDALRTRSTEGDTQDSGRNNNGYVRSRNLSGPDSASISSSPMNAATAKFNMYLQPSSNRESRDSLSRSSPNSSPLLPSVQLSSSSSAGSTSSLVTRSYAKRPPPPPKDTPNSPGSTMTPPPAQGRESVQSRESRSSSLGPSSLMHDNSRESRPEPPPKDTSRRHYTGSGNGGSSISSQPPFLSIETHQGHPNNFASVVEATMNRHKVNASVSSTSSGAFNFSDPSVKHQPQSSSRTKTSSGHSVQSSQSLHSGNGYVSEKQTHQNPADLNHRRTSEGHGHGHSHSNHQPSTSHGHPDRNSHSKSHRQPQNNLQNGPVQNPYQDKLPYHKHGGSMSQLDLLGSMQRPQSGSGSNPSASYVSERARSYSHGSVSNPNSSRAGQGYGRVLKPAILKTPIARARAKEMHGPRKVNFGEMITIVTIERAETPPPLPPADKKQKKKQMQQAKKMAAANNGKGGQQQNFDPEYNAEYYNAPYTPVPAEVVVTLAPWIGNPNYDEEKQNSKFYYEDDYDDYDDDDEYETPYESDIRLGPEDDEDDTEDEDEDDEDDEEGGSHVWGHGIGGGGGSFPKKKGGMFKFKRAVNRLLRN